MLKKKHVLNVLTNRDMKELFNQEGLCVQYPNDNDVKNKQHAQEAFKKLRAQSLLRAVGFNPI